MHVKAYIAGDGLTGINSAARQPDRRRRLDDHLDRRGRLRGSRIRGVAGGVAIAIAVAYNEISTEVVASIANATHHVTSTVGAITVSAMSQGRRLFDLTTLTAAQLDDAGTVDGTSADATDDAALKITLSNAFAAGGEPLPGTITVTILDPGIAWRVTTANGGNYLIHLVGGVLKVTAPTAIQAIAAAAVDRGRCRRRSAAGISGAGAVATNVILTKTNATITDSVINSATDVDLDATNPALIRAKILTAAAGVGVGLRRRRRVDRRLHRAQFHRLQRGRDDIHGRGACGDHALERDGRRQPDPRGRYRTRRSRHSSSRARSRSRAGWSASRQRAPGATTQNGSRADVKATIDGDGTSATGITAASIAAVGARHLEDRGQHRVRRGRRDDRARGAAIAIAVATRRTRSTTRSRRRSRTPTRSSRRRPAASSSTPTRRRRSLH